MFIRKLGGYFRSLKETAFNHRKEASFREELSSSFPELKMEDRVVIRSHDRMAMQGPVLLQYGTIVHCGGMEWCGYEGYVHFGSHIEVSPYCILYGSGGIEIGDFCRFGPGSQVLSQEEVNSANPQTEGPNLRFEEVKLGKACLIGAGAIILAGTVLGDHCIVGPNAVVQGDFPARSTIIGNPARVLPRMSFDE